MDQEKNISGDYPWGHKRRFNAFPDYFRKVYGSRMQKVSVDAGFTCPNRDGSKGTGGCTYCNNKAFNPSYCLPEKPVTKQIEEGIEFHKKRYRKTGSYLVYFQAYSNTYASLGTLSDLYNEALEHKDVKGLVIGTRPDPGLSHGSFGEMYHFNRIWHRIVLRQNIAADKPRTYI
jgi:radical SAM protein (TIGR01212 family)